MGYSRRPYKLLINYRQKDLTKRLEKIKEWTQSQRDQEMEAAVAIAGQDHETKDTPIISDTNETTLNRGFDLNTFISMEEYFTEIGIKLKITILSF